MKRLLLVALTSILGLAATALAGSEIKMTGDVTVNGNYLSNSNFTPWSARGMNYYTGQPQPAFVTGAPSPATGAFLKPLKTGPLKPQK